MIRFQRSHLWVVVVVALLFGATVGGSWLSPKRGVDRAWTKLLDAIETNDMEDFAALLDDGYRDRAGLGKVELTAAIQAGRRQFFTCTVEGGKREVTLTDENRRSTVSGVIRIDGTGTAIAQEIIRFAQRSDEPVSTQWVRGSWKPWDWRLLSLDHPESASTLRRLQRDAGAAGLGF